jgi:hypothetical protein
MRHEEEELPPSSLRGRLCEVFFSALVAEMIEPLMRRLGDKAELDDPFFGGAQGAALQPRLNEWKVFLGEHATTYDRTITIVGADRDVTEGTLEARVDGQHRTLPIAVLMERRREREVALRVYSAVAPFKRSPKGPTAAPAKPVVPRSSSDGAAVPTFLADLLVALSKRDASAVTACFELDSSVRDPLGAEHPRDAAVRLLPPELVIYGIADNGQACGVEVMLPAEGDGRRLGLMVLGRGESGLIRSLRVYSEI